MIFMAAISAEKTIELANNVTKLAANLSEKPEPKKDIYSNDTQSKASTGSQNIQIHMGDDKEKKPPIEKHIHTFPNGRALTSEECALDLKKAQMEYDLRKTEQNYAMKINEREYQHRLEQEKKAEKRAKFGRIVGGILAACGLAGISYCIYSDYRDSKNQPVNQNTVQEDSNNKA